MAKELFPPGEPLTVELLAQKIKEVRDAADNRINDVQSQLNKLKSQIKTADEKTALRLSRIVERIDSVFDNLQQMVGCLDELSAQLNTQKGDTDKLRSSAMANKANINKVGDYLKEVDKTLKQLRVDVNKLNESDTKMLVKLLIKIGAALGVCSTGVTWIIKSGSLDGLFSFLGWQ